jgi:hypothetical protein
LFVCDIRSLFVSHQQTNDLVSTVGFANTNSEISWSESTWTNVNDFTVSSYLNP